MAWFVLTLRRFVPSLSCPWLPAPSSPFLRPPPTRAHHRDTTSLLPAQRAHPSKEGSREVRSSGLDPPPLFHPLAGFIDWSRNRIPPPRRPNRRLLPRQPGPYHHSYASRLTSERRRSVSALVAPCPICAPCPVAAPAPAGPRLELKSDRRMDHQLRYAIIALISCGVSVFFWCWIGVLDLSSDSWREGLSSAVEGEVQRAHMRDA